MQQGITPQGIKSFSALIEVFHDNCLHETLENILPFLRDNCQPYKQVKGILNPLKTEKKVTVLSFKDFSYVFVKYEEYSEVSQLSLHSKYDMESWQTVPLTWKTSDFFFCFLSIWGVLQ